MLYGVPAPIKDDDDVLVVRTQSRSRSPTGSPPRSARSERSSPKSSRRGTRPGTATGVGWGITEWSETATEISQEGEVLVFDRGIKTNFREMRSRWMGHVSTQIYLGQSWSEKDGAGRCFRFTVYDPLSAGYYLGEIRNERHLREVLGANGQHFLELGLTHAEEIGLNEDERREREFQRMIDMLIFICKTRLEVVRNLISWDGEPTEDGAPAYRIEFMSDRLFDNSKVTPLNVGGHVDELANRDKLIDNYQARGRKINRVVRRISGLLLQLTVFEVLSDEDLAEERAEEENRVMKAMQELAGEMGVVTASPALHSDVGEGQIKDSSEAEGSKSALKKSRNITRKKLEPNKPPHLRIIGYDPRSKRKAVMECTKECTMELAGGGYSPFLEKVRRKELSRMICDLLLLSFPKGKGFELFVPWTGMSKLQTAGEAGDKVSKRSTAEKVIKRHGKVFRGAMKITEIDCLVTVYAQPAPKTSEYNNEKQLVFNFYSTQASEAFEMLVTDDEQRERIGKTLLSLPDGDIRSTAIRRFAMRWFHLDLVEADDGTMATAGKKDLMVDLMTKGHGKNSTLASSAGGKEVLRLYGFPKVFESVGCQGDLLHRRVLKIQIMDYEQQDFIEEADFITSVYSKELRGTPDKGLVVRLYERGASDTIVVHLGLSEIERMCNAVHEPDLLKDIVQAKLDSDGASLDDVEAGFVQDKAKSDMVEEFKKLTDHLIDIVLSHVGVKEDVTKEKHVPYMIGSNDNVRL